jgi:putative peptidoglycan lipid II flippase
MSRRIRIAALIWTGSLLASRLIGLVRERVLGRTLGIGSEADVYAAAFRIPDLFNYLLAGGALSIVFIPIFTAHLEEGREDRGWRAFSVIANSLLLVMGILVPCLAIAMPVLGRIAAPGFSPEQIALLVRLTRIVLPGQVFHLLGGLLSATLLSRDRHAVPALSPLLYNLSIIAGGLLTRSAEGFAWGVLIGAFLGSFAVPFLACLRSGLRWMPVLTTRDPDFRRWLRLSVPVMLGWSIVAMDDPLLTRFGSHLGQGQVALLNYAKTLMRVPMGIFGAAMAYAAYPTLARLCAEGRVAEAYRTLTGAVRRVLVLAFASEVALTAAGPELGTLIYTTRRIAPADLGRLGLYLALFSLALGAWSAQALLARGFYARAKAWFPTWLGTGIMVLSLPAYILLGRSLGGPGLCLASSAAITVYVWLLARKLRNEIGEPSGYTGFLLRIVAAGAVAFGVGLLVRRLLPPPEWRAADALWRTAVLWFASVGIFLAGAWFLGVREVKELAAGLAIRRGRR